ncbi:hypothetical protein M409DRAFT_56366 [Zasmidium cellare ATCC 36951]|uniref:Zn(2)-C6 fungal-type domain-containing protein n=1 Tax=Zasmidium cellare ATCC 36951 TaxID=1080233 RepID=A0A6A6CBI9_ZASCE|nr:uncharacterized protein M409DRAFT_56366 [Zasmidium cellare ATCC 36951]KAF2164524.1 hypothetical protein M409DRAFT_56366 [Zasmidium cellare ATCC 36951]
MTGKAQSLRTSLTPSACQGCRISKVKDKCSGQRPSCTRCTTRGQKCSYEVAKEGLTKREFFRDKHQEQQKELKAALTILEILREGSDQEAAATLARLRTGMTLTEEYEKILANKASQFKYSPAEQDDQLARKITTADLGLNEYTRPFLHSTDTPSLFSYPASPPSHYLPKEYAVSTLAPLWNYLDERQAPNASTQFFDLQFSA